MLPGPTIIKKCSVCSGLINKHTIASGNTFGAIYWTDGKMDAPMLPDDPKLVKCPHCRSSIWIDRLDTIEEIDPFEHGSTHAEEPLRLEFDDYNSFLTGNRLLKPDAERELRMRAWWRGNDGRRRGEKSVLSETESENLPALNKLLDESDNTDRLMQAEIMRELGNIEQALESLHEPFDKQLSAAQSQSSENLLNKVTGELRRSTLTSIKENRCR